MWNILYRSKFCSGYRMLIKFYWITPSSTSNAYWRMWRCDRRRHKSVHTSNLYCCVSENGSAVATRRMQIFRCVRSAAFNYEFSQEHIDFCFYHSYLLVPEKIFSDLSSVYHWYLILLMLTTNWCVASASEARMHYGL